MSRLIRLQSLESASIGNGKWESSSQNMALGEVRMALVSRSSLHITHP